MFALLLASGLLHLGSGSAGRASPSPIAVRVRPDPVYAERVGGLLRVSCDFELTNSSDRAYEIGNVHAKAFSASGELLA